MSGNHDHRILSYVPDDGYDEAGYIKAESQIYGELRFRFRPVLTEIRSAHLAALDTMKADTFDRKTAKLVEEHLKEWSLVDGKGNAVPIKAPNILRLKPKLFVRLYSVVMGLEPSDIDPKWADSTKDDVTDLEYQSALDGTTVGQIREVRDEKNSEAG